MLWHPVSLKKKKKEKEKKGNINVAYLFLVAGGNKGQMNTLCIKKQNCYSFQDS